MNFDYIIIWIVFVALFLMIAIITFTVVQQRRFIKQDKEIKAIEKEQSIRLAEAMIKSQELERKSIGENLHEDVV